MGPHRLGNPWTRGGRSVPSLEWDESLAVGVEPIDEQHRTFLRMANELHGALLGADFPAYLQARRRAVEGLEHYVATHFADEEAWMARVRYPGLAAHRRRHEEFTAMVRRFAASLGDGSPALGSEIMKSMILWFRQHIAEEDQQILPRDGRR